MGNFYSSQVMPQSRRIYDSLLTPLIEEKEVRVNMKDKDSKEAKNNRDENEKPQIEPKSVQLKRRRRRIEDMILNDKELLPEEFDELEELKEIYKAQKEEKTKNLSEDLLECELVAFERAKVTCIVMTNDRKYIISSTSEGTIVIYDFKSRNLVRYFEDDARRKINSLVISEDNKYLVAAIGKDVKLFDLATKTQTLCLRNAHDSEILSVLISKDKEFIITGGGDCSIKIFEVSTQKEVHKFVDAHKGPVSCMAFSNDNNRFISASEDGSVKIFDFKEKEEVHHFATAHKGSIFSVAVSQDDKYIITGSADRSINIFSLKSTEELYYVEDVLQDEICTVVVSNDNKYIFCGSKDLTVKILDLETQQEISRYDILNRDLRAPVMISNDGKYIFSGSEDTSVMIFDVEKEEKSFLRYPVKNIIYSVAISDDSKYIISGSKDCCLKIFDFNGRKEIQQYMGGEQGYASSLAISPKNKFFACGVCGVLSLLKLFDLETMKEIHKFSNFEDTVTAVSFSSDENLVLAASNDCSIRVFEIEDLQEKRKFMLKSGVQAFCLSQDMKYLIAGLMDGATVAISFNANVEIFRSRSTIGGKVNSVILSQDNKYIISGHSTDLIKVYNLETKQLVYNLYFKGETNSVALTKDNKYIVSCSSDSCINVWDFESGQEIYCYENSDVYTMTLSNDNQHIVMGLKNGAIKVIRMNPKLAPYELASVPGNDHVKFFGLSRDNNIAVIVYRSGLLRLFDLQSNNLMYETNLGGKNTFVLFFIKTIDIYGGISMPNNGSYIVFGDKKNQKIKGFNLRTRKEILSFELEKEDLIHNLAISKDGKFLAAIISDTVTMFDLFAKERRWGIISSDSRGSIIISNNNNYVVVGDRNGNIKIYDLQTSDDVFYFKEAHKSMVCSLALSTNDKYLVAGFFGSIKIFDMETKQEIHHFEQVHFGAVNSVVISSDDRFIVSGSNDQSVKMFDIHAKIQLLEISTSSAVNHVSISKDNKYIFAGGLIYPTCFCGTLELNYVSSKIPIGSFFAAGNDNFLTLSWPKDAETQKRYLMCYRDMYVHPHNWTVLHLLAIFNPPAISQVPEYSQFQVQFLLDSYDKTPLHYLLVQKTRDFVVINTMLKYIIDYLEDTTRIKPFEHQKICSSLSNCFLFIISKASPSLIYKYLNLCYPETSPQYNGPVFSFGESLQKYTYSYMPVMHPEVFAKLYKEGDDRIIFRTNLVRLDYDPRSDDMLKTTHILTEIQQEAIFKLPMIDNLIDHLWASTRSIMRLTAIAFSFLMIFLSIYIGIGQRAPLLEFVILLLTILFLISECIHGSTLGIEYLKTVWNWGDAILFLLITIFMLTKLGVENFFFFGEAWMVSIMIIIGYLRWLSYLRLFTPTRILIQIILTVLKDMMGFIIIIASILIGFSLIFYEFARTRNLPYDYGYHFYNTFKLLFGNYDDSEYNLSQIILVSVLLCVLNVVLLNLLIAIIGDSYSNIQQGKELVDAQTRLDMIEDAMILMRMMRPKNTVQKTYLIYRLPAITEEATLENKEWEDRINKIEKTFNQNKDEELANIKNEMKNVGEQVNQNTENQVAQVRNEMISLGEEVNQIKKEFKEEIKNEIKNMQEQLSQNVEQQVRGEIRSLREQVSQIESEVKENVRNEIKSMGEQVSLIKDEIQGLKQLINLVLTNLNEARK